MRFASSMRRRRSSPSNAFARCSASARAAILLGRPASRRQRDDMVMLAHVLSAFTLSNGTYGSPRMMHEPRDKACRSAAAVQPGSCETTA